MTENNDYRKEDSQEEDCSKQDHLDLCMELFAQHQQRMYLFIQAMVPSPADAEEILQETNIVIWKKFQRFDPNRPGSDFLSWAYRIAVNEIKAYQRRSKKKVPSFSSQVLEQLAATATEQQSVFDERRAALQICLNKLPEKDRDLLKSCYAPQASIPQIAAQLTRTLTSVYRSLRRIRQILADCIEKRTSAYGS